MSEWETLYSVFIFFAGLMVGSKLTICACKRGWVRELEDQ